MSRTLGRITDDQLFNQSDDSANQPFYLTNELPMFLAHNPDQLSGNASIDDEDMAKCKELIENLCDYQLKTREGLEDISALVKQQKDLSKAMGYFSAKNLVFLQYLMLLKLYQLFKINGRSLTTGNGLQLYHRLAYLKTLLLKLQPVQKKLEYQKNKILKHSDKVQVTKQQNKNQSEQEENQQQQENENNQMKDEQEEFVENQQDEKEEEEDQMAFKPRPSALMRIKHQKDIKLNKNDKYQAPKVSSNLSKQDKIRQRMQRQKQIRKVGLIRRLQSDLIDDDRAQQRFLGDEINERFKRKFQEKINYEEQAFTRLPDTKKDKFYMKQVVKNSMRKNQLEEDFKEVQMVRQLFENENKTEHKILSDKRQKEAKFKHQQKEKDTQKNGKTKHIKKQSNK